MKLKQPICKKQEKIGCIASGKTSRKVQAKYEFVLWPTAKRSFSYIHSCDNYAMFMDYARPKIDLYKNGDFLQRFS